MRWGITCTSAAEGPARDAVRTVVKQTRRDLDTGWDRTLETPDSADVRARLLLNGSPRLR